MLSTACTGLTSTATFLRGRSSAPANCCLERALKCRELLDGSAGEGTQIEQLSNGIVAYLNEQTLFAITRLQNYPITKSASLRRGGIDGGLDLRDLVSGKAALLGMLADRLLIRSDVYAINLVLGDVTVHPLHLGTKFFENAA